MGGVTNLHEFMQQMSYREFKMRLAWLDKQWNEPDRSDHYLMKIIAYLARLPSPAEARDATLYKIPFVFKPVGDKDTAAPSVSEGEARQLQSRTAWSAALGGGKPKQ